MQIQTVTPVIPVPNLGEAIRQLAAILGCEPTIVDGDRWAQFDVAGRRIAVAAGGSSDVLARIVGKAMSEGLRQPLVTQHKAIADYWLHTRSGFRVQVEGTEAPWRDESLNRQWEEAI